MTIDRILMDRGPVLTCDADCTVGDAVARLAEGRIGALPIVDGGQVIGIFSERDVIYKLAELGPEALALPVTRAMTAPAVTVSPDAGVLEALSLMTRRRIRHLPVMRDGAMIGFVSIGDLVKYRIEQVQSEAAAMREYIQTA